MDEHERVSKMPFLPEETLRIQRVEVYLADLKKRLKELRLKHDEVIKSSVEIIKEIDDVSSSMLIEQNSDKGSAGNLSKIKKLIQEFENVKDTSPTVRPTVLVEGKVNIREILQNFEKLNDSHVLKDSLILLKRAKESLDKIDTIISIGNVESSNPQPALNACSSLKNRINMFNAKDAAVKDDDFYSSCCSSGVSLQVFHSPEDIHKDVKNTQSLTNSLEIGYEGDNDDSEYDLLAIKKKRK